MSILPTKKQHAGWSLPSKYTFWSFLAGLFFGILSTALTIYFGIQNNPKIDLLLDAIRAEKPTSIEIHKVELLHMLGDAEPFLVVTLENQTSRPALSVTTHLITFAGDIVLTPTKASNIYQSPSLTLPANGQLEFPVGARSEIAKALGLKCISSFSLHALNSPPIGRHEAESVAFEVSVGFKTVFGEAVSGATTVFANSDESCQ